MVSGTRDETTATHSSDAEEVGATANNLKRLVDALHQYHNFGVRIQRIQQLGVAVQREFRGGRSRIQVFVWHSNRAEKSVRALFRNEKAVSYVRRSACRHDRRAPRAGRQQQHDAALGYFAKRHDRELFAAGMKANVERDSRPTLSADPGLGLGARRAAGVACAGFEARFSISRLAMEVRFVRRASTERRVGPKGVEPGGEAFQLALKRRATHRDDEAAQELSFQRANQPLDEGDAAALADRPEPRTDLATAAPGLEASAPELSSFVDDDVARFGSRAAHGATEELPDIAPGGASFEDPQSLHAAGIMVHDEDHPPAERPALRKGERKPCRPEPQARRHGREVGMPDIVRPDGGDPLLLRLGDDGFRRFRPGPRTPVCTPPQTNPPVGSRQSCSARLPRRLGFRRPPMRPLARRGRTVRPPLQVSTTRPPAPLPTRLARQRAGCATL